MTDTVQTFALQRRTPIDPSLVTNQIATSQNVLKWVKTTGHDKAPRIPIKIIPTVETPKTWTGFASSCHRRVKWRASSQLCVNKSCIRCVKKWACPNLPNVLVMVPRPYDYGRYLYPSLPILRCGAWSPQCA